jgi:T5SS/PEP-CTERM-associated repeat protein
MGRFLTVIAAFTSLDVVGIDWARAAVDHWGNNSPSPTMTNGDPIIGVNAIGRLTITAGSVVASDVALVGDQPTGMGLVTVTDFNFGTDAASRWIVNSLMVADEGAGRLEILNGALVSVDFEANPGAGDLVIGNTTDSLGTIIVSGLGSMLRMGDATSVGVAGTGVLRIENEGFVNATNDLGMTPDMFTVGARGRVELDGGRLRTKSFTNNGAILGTGRIDSENMIANSTTGRMEVGSGDRLDVNALVDNDGEISVASGEIEFLEQVVNSHAAAKVTLQNGVVRFPKAGFGFDSTTGVLATTGGSSDIYGTVRLQGAGSRIAVGGDSTAVFHDPVTNSGGVIEVFPGSTLLLLQGLTTMGPGSALSVHLTNPDQQPDLGQVEVAGSAQLEGNLQLTLAAGFVPKVGDSFQIVTAAGGITGSLALASAPALPGGLQWDLDVNPTTVVLNVLSSGDYNGDGAVDAADYLLWRNTLGQAGPALPADGDGSGVVDAADYDIWRNRFGNVVGGGMGAALAVPEPRASVLITFAMTVSLLYRRKFAACIGQVPVRKA